MHSVLAGRHKHHAIVPHWLQAHATGLLGLLLVSGTPATILVFLPYGSHSENIQCIDIFLTRYLNVLNTPKIHCTPRVLHYVAAHIYENNDDGALGIESAPREFTKLHLSLMGNVTIYYYTPSHGRVD